jgi:hypothetical protein
MEKGSRATVGEGSPQAAAILATICAMSCALVPAAGSASRFGGGKLIAPVEGRPMLDRTIGALLEGGI